MKVVFDLDGTLVDSAPDIHASVTTVLRRRGREELDLPTIKSFVGHGLPPLTRRVVEAVGLPLSEHEPFTQDVLAEYIAHSADLTQPYPGVIAALSMLKKEGHVFGLCTNKPEAPARTVIETLGLGPFDVVIGGDTLTQRKPDPAPLLAALNALPGDQAIYIGDSEVDAETAARAKVPFFLFTEGYRKTGVSQIPHTAAFSDFAKLPELVANVSQN